jgi:hypothetical protein
MDELGHCNAGVSAETRNEFQRAYAQVGQLDGLSGVEQILRLEVCS